MFDGTASYGCNLEMSGMLERGVRLRGVKKVLVLIYVRCFPSTDKDLTRVD